jgi:transposase InsO family protein
MALVETEQAPRSVTFGENHDQAVGETERELQNAVFEYIESFHNNHRRRHSSLNMLTPTEFEELHQKKSS